ncbi:MOXD2 protein, partial [Bucco capensis]|nr:MOXD2 protein [Bucco capensis]
IDTAHLITGFGIDDTVQFFKSQRLSKSLFMMRYRGPSDSTDPKILFTYDLRLDRVSIGQEYNLYTCTFMPLPMVKQKHLIYKVNLQATGQDRFAPSTMHTNLYFYSI